MNFRASLYKPKADNSINKLFYSSQFAARILLGLKLIFSGLKIQFRAYLTQFSIQPATIFNLILKDKSTKRLFGPAKKELKAEK